MADKKHNPNDGVPKVDEPKDNRGNKSQTWSPTRGERTGDQAEDEATEEEYNPNVTKH